jgi:hypothetical protein
MTVVLSGYDQSRRPYSELTLTGVAVEKGTKAVISVNFSVYGRRTFNNLTYVRISLLKFSKNSFSKATGDYTH